jgi:hypothetical protein
MKKINFISNYKNDSIFSSSQYGHYSSGYNLFRKKAVESGYAVVENEEISENSIVIFRDLPNKKFVNSKPNGTFFILQIWESPLDRPALFNEKNWVDFDLVLSCNSKIKNIKHREINYFIDEVDFNNCFIPFDSRKLAVAICSNRYNGILAPRKGKGLFSLPILQEIDREWNNDYFNLFFKRPKGLYSRRRVFLNKKFNLFDLYGRYWSKDDIQSWIRYFKFFINNNFCSKGEYNGNKLELLGNYRYALAFENYSNSTSYISEKIFECLRAGCVPLYYGCENITDYIPKDCFIYVSEDVSPSALKCIISSMSEEEWNNYILNGRNFLSSQGYIDVFSANAFSDKLFKYVTELDNYFSF